METPPPKELLKKLVKLEESQEHIKQEISRLKVSTVLTQPSPSLSPYRPARRRNIGDGAPAWRKSGVPSFRQDSINFRAGVGGGDGPSAGKLTNKKNAMSEKVYGHTAEEVVGRNPVDVLVDDRDAHFAMNVAQRCLNGESWTGEFPVKSKSGERISSVTTCSPFYDDDGSLVGIISITSNTAQYLHSLAQLKAQEGETSSSFASNTFASRLGLDSKGAVRSKLGLDSDQPIQAAIASKISDLASRVSNKVRSKMRAGDTSATLSKGFFGATLSDHRDNASSSGANIPRGDSIRSPYGVFTCNNPYKDYSDESDGKSAIPEVLTSKSEHEVSKGRLTHSVWPWVQNEQEKDKSHQINPYSDVNSESHSSESNKPTNNDASSLWSSSINANSSTSSCASTSSSVMNMTNTYTDCLEDEILWDDLTIGEEIGQGSCATVYHGLWFGSDVAVKVFSKQEYSEEVMRSFKQEVSLMKILRHPNILLFMGALTSPQRLCIVSEFLPRGSLFRLLQKSSSKLDWRRRIHMALDIARGMNYLHCCSPPIIHRDLKSSNLLVDRNWTVKVADFGISRIKHETYLTTKSGEGTPQWMAPEVLRNESADENSDIYSFGVVLWELATGKIPWETLNSMQVIGAVGFLNQRLEIPKDIDPRWISLIESCWHSDTKLRPTFLELIEKLRDLQRKYMIQSRAGLLDNPLLEDN